RGRSASRSGAHGEAGSHGLGQVELVNQCLEVDGEGVVVVGRRGLARVPKPAPVVSDHALAGFQRYETDRPNQPGLRRRYRESSKEWGCRGVRAYGVWGGLRRAARTRMSRGGWPAAHPLATRVSPWR